MKKFIAIYYAPAAAMQAMATVSDEDKAKGMEPWFAWKAKYEDQIVDFGSPLMPGNAIDVDGNWTNSSKEVTGYSIVQAKDVASAKEMFKGHVHLGWAPGCSIDVHEFAAM